MFFVPHFTRKILLQALRAPWILWAPRNCGNCLTTSSWGAGDADGHLGQPYPWALGTSLERGQDLFKTDTAWKVLGHLEN